MNNPLKQALTALAAITPNITSVTNDLININNATLNATHSQSPDNNRNTVSNNTHVGKGLFYLFCAVAVMTVVLVLRAFRSSKSYQRNSSSANLRLYGAHLRREHDRLVASNANRHVSTLPTIEEEPAPLIAPARERYYGKDGVNLESDTSQSIKSIPQKPAPLHFLR